MDVTVLFKLTSGLYIIGTKDGEKKAGCVVNTVLQATSNPVTLTVCINKENFTNICIKNSKEFTVSILSECVKENVLGVFGFSSSRSTDKFINAPYALTSSGVPYINEGVAGFIHCKTVSFADNYTHTVFIAEVQDAQKISDETPMTYAYYHNVIKGKTPKNASSHISEDIQAAGNMKAGAYKCGICGYEFSGSKEEFETLPDDFKCLMCQSPKSLFKYS